MIEAIFFDFDGVLVDSEPLHFDCWAEVLAGYGMPITAEFYAENFIGVSNQEMIEILCRKFNRSHGMEFFAECYAQKKALYQKRAPAHCRTPPELVSFFRERSGVYQLGVVSSSSRCEVEPHLAGQGIRDKLAALVCQEDVENLKPAPDPYLRALALVNLAARKEIAPQECLVVEDSGPGAEAGRLAGMQVLRVPSPEHVRPSLEKILRRSCC
jgi:beta-phosphoglucomutase